MHKEIIKEELTGTILLEFLKEHFEVLHPHYNFYLSNFCKNYNKIYPTILAMNNFLKSLSNENRPYSKGEFQSLI